LCLLEFPEIYPKNDVESPSFDLRILRIIALKGVDYMLRQKISIVLAPKVLTEINAIAKENQIKSTELTTRLVEELFIRNKKMLLELLVSMSIDLPENFGNIVDHNAIDLPFAVKEIVIPDKCPLCGESEDILGSKVLYENGGFIHCKACLGKFEPDLR